MMGSGLLAMKSEGKASGLHSDSVEDHGSAGPSCLMVTGGAGFIGTNFVRYVLAHHPDTHIVVYDLLTYAAKMDNLHGLIPDRIDMVHADICDVGSVDRAIRQHHVDAIVHFAAESHNDNSIQDPGPFIRTNLYGTYVLLEAARRHDLRFHQVSTDEVFGDLDFGDPRRFTETSPYRPSSPYSATKAGADHLARAWWRTYGTRMTISNCSNNYGPYQHIEKFIPRQITNILSGIRPRIYGQGQAIRDWIHVEDDCRAIWSILVHGTPGSTYLIGADGELSNMEVLRMILHLMGRGVDEFDLVADRPGGDRRYAIDAGKIRRDLGWQPLHRDFEQGLAETIDWYSRHRKWWAGDKQAVEARYREQGH